MWGLIKILDSFGWGLSVKFIEEAPAPLKMCRSDVCEGHVLLHDLVLQNVWGLDILLFAPSVQAARSSHLCPRKLFCVLLMYARCSATCSALRRHSACKCLGWAADGRRPVSMLAVQGRSDLQRSLSQIDEQQLCRCPAGLVLMSKPVP